jgi:hypothetical protein
MPDWLAGVLKFALVMSILVVGHVVAAVGYLIDRKPRRRHTSGDADPGA